MREREQKEMEKKKHKTYRGDGRVERERDQGSACLRKRG